MKRLIWDDDVEEIDLGDGDYVTLGSSLTVKDMTAISSAENQAEASMVLLKRAIKSWRGPSFERNGELVPVSPENIDRLEMSTATTLANRLAERVTQDKMDDGEKKGSMPSSSDISMIP